MNESRMIVFLRKLGLGAGLLLVVAASGCQSVRPPGPGIVAAPAVNASATTTAEASLPLPSQSATPVYAASHRLQPWVPDTPIEPTSSSFYGRSVRSTGSC